MLSLSSLELWYGYYIHILFNIHSNSENYFSVNHKNLERLKSLIFHLSSFFRKNIKNKKCFFQSQVVKAKTCTDFFIGVIFLHITNIKIHIINFKAQKKISENKYIVIPSKKNLKSIISVETNL